MSATDQLIQAGAAAIEDLLTQLGVGESEEGDTVATTLARAVLHATQPRIRSLKELEDLPDESAVRTSDSGDTVVLKNGKSFTNACGADIDVDTLWRYATHPLHLIYRPAEEASEAS